MPNLDQAFRDAHVKAERFNGHGANINLRFTRADLQDALDALDALDTALDDAGESERCARRRWGQMRRERVVRLLDLLDEGRCNVAKN